MFKTQIFKKKIGGTWVVSWACFSGHSDRATLLGEKDGPAQVPTHKGSGLTLKPQPTNWYFKWFGSYFLFA